MSLLDGIDLTDPDGPEPEEDEIDLAALEEGGGPATDDDGEDFPGEKMPKILSAFQQRSKDEESRFSSVTDSEYWVCLCFQSREQAEEFAAKAGLPAGEKYVDGRRLARKMGIELAPAAAPRRTRSAGKGLTELV